MGHNDLILDLNLVHIFEQTKAYCQSLGYDDTFINELWEGIILHKEMHQEFDYFLKHHELCGDFSYEGYNLFDLYFFELRHYNLTHDLGRNLKECDKDEVSILAFHTMGQLMKNPEYYKRKLEKGMGMDFF